jgi:hypothetical protein
MDMSVEQGIHGVRHFMDHIFSWDLVGKIILIALQLYKWNQDVIFIY